MFHSDAIPSHAALRGWIRRSVRPPGNRPDALAFDADDIGQELVLGLLMAAPGYDPARGSPQTYAAAVFRRVGGELRRRRGRVERHGRPLSLEELEAEEAVDPAGAARDSANDLRSDLLRAIATLPADLVPLAAELLVGSVAGVARGRKLPRTTLMRRIERLKKHFESAGLEIYL